MPRLALPAGGLALLLSSCGVRVEAPRPVQVVKIYTFPLTLADDSQVCVEASFGPEDPCISLGQLRRLVRGTGAN